MTESKKAQSGPPQAYKDFIKRFPKLGQAWDFMRQAGQDAGSLTEREILLVKLGVALGANRSGAVTSATRKALKAGVSAEDVEQAIALSASTVGMPATVAAFGWTRKYCAPEASDEG